MVSRRVLFLSFFVLLVVLAATPVSHGATVQYQVNADNVTLKMNLALVENETGLPLVSFYVDSSNSTAIADNVTAALHKLAPGISVSKLTLRAQSTNSSGTWSLIENYTVVFQGGNKNLGSSVRANIAYISMDVPGAVQNDGLELNTVGLTYLVKPLESQSNQTGYYVNDHQFLTASIPITTTIEFHLLDFSWVPSLSGWTHSQDLLAQTTSWSYDTGSPRFNLTFGPKSSTENTLVKKYMAVFSPSFLINVPANAWTDGTNLAFDVPTLAEILMPAIIGVSIVTLGVSLFFDRRMTKNQRFRPKKK